MSFKICKVSILIIVAAQFYIGFFIIKHDEAMGTESTSRLGVNDCLCLLHSLSPSKSHSQNRRPIINSDYLESDVSPCPMIKMVVDFMSQVNCLMQLMMMSTTWSGIGAYIGYVLGVHYLFSAFVSGQFTKWVRVSLFSRKIQF